MQTQLEMRCRNTPLHSFSVLHYDHVSGEINGPDLPDTSGSEVLGDTADISISKAPMGRWDVEEGFI